MRRLPQTQWRFLRNADPEHLEVHDLDNEQTGSNECQIDEIKDAYYVQIENTKTALEAWFRANPGYDGCYWCLNEYHGK